MYYAPFTMVVDGDVLGAFHFDHISSAAQRWAEEEDAVIYDANGVEVDEDSLWDVLAW